MITLSNYFISFYFSFLNLGARKHKRHDPEENVRFKTSFDIIVDYSEYSTIQVTIQLQYNPLNVITSGHREGDNISGSITYKVPNINLLGTALENWTCSSSIIFSTCIKY